MQAKKICENCGNEFPAGKPSKSTKYCSFSCYQAFRKKNGWKERLVPQHEFSCQACGKLFRMRPGNVRSYRKKFGRDRLYCSTKCGGIGRKRESDKQKVVCAQCDKEIPVQRRPGGTLNRQKKFCSTACRGLSKRLGYQAKHAGKAPSRTVGRWGYMRLKVLGTGGNPSRDVLEHRYVMEQSIGRMLTRDETVHHVNGVKTDNRLENLELFTSRHGPGQRVRDQIRWAIEIIDAYPDFARKAGVKLVRDSTE